MFPSCGEALYDLFPSAETDTGFTFDARIGGSPFNVAIGLSRLGRGATLFTGLSSDPLGRRLERTLKDEGVATTWLVSKRNPTTLALVGLGPRGVPHYSFYGHDAADCSVGEAHRVRERLLPLPARGGERARPGVLPDPAGRVRGVRRPLRLREIHDLPPAARLREAGFRRGVPRRPRSLEPRPPGRAQPHGGGAAGRPPVGGQHLPEHRGPRSHHPGRCVGGGAGGRPRRGRPGHADGHAHDRARGRERTVRRTEATAADGPRPRPPAAHPAVRRSHQRPRQPHPGDRAGVAQEAGRAS